MLLNNKNLNSYLGKKANCGKPVKIWGKRFEKNRGGLKRIMSYAGTIE
jgi:hypothetical protein